MSSSPSAPAAAPARSAPVVRPGARSSRHLRAAYATGGLGLLLLAGLFLLPSVWPESALSDVLAAYREIGGQVLLAVGVIVGGSSLRHVGEGRRGGDA